MVTGQAQDVRSLLTVLNAVLGPFVAPAINATRVGGCYEFVDQTINTTDTTFTLYNFQRKPSRIVITGQHQAGSVFNGTNQRSDWNEQTVVLRASVQGTYSFIVF